MRSRPPPPDPPVVRAEAQTIWFETAAQRQLVAMAGKNGWQLVGRIHARQIGSVVTACGVSTLEWPMLFYRSFDGRSPDTCPACMHLVL